MRLSIVRFFVLSLIVAVHGHQKSFVRSPGLRANQHIHFLGETNHDEGHTRSQPPSYMVPAAKRSTVGDERKLEEESGDEQTEENNSTNENDDDKGQVKETIQQYGKMAEDKFWELYQSPPAEWTQDQWGFFAAIVSLMSVIACCICVVCVQRCCCGRRESAPEGYEYYSDGDEEETELATRKAKFLDKSEFLGKKMSPKRSYGYHNGILSCSSSATSSSSSSESSGHLSVISTSSSSSIGAWGGAPSSASTASSSLLPTTDVPLTANREVFIPTSTGSLIAPSSVSSLRTAHSSSLSTSSETERVYKQPNLNDQPLGCPNQVTGRENAVVSDRTQSPAWSLHSLQPSISSDKEGGRRLPVSAPPSLHDDVEYHKTDICHSEGSQRVATSVCTAPQREGQGSLKLLEQQSEECSEGKDLGKASEHMSPNNIDKYEGIAMKMDACVNESSITPFTLAAQNINETSGDYKLKQSDEVEPIVYDSCASKSSHSVDTPTVSANAGATVDQSSIVSSSSSVADPENETTSDEECTLIVGSNNAPTCAGAVQAETVKADNESDTDLLDTAYINYVGNEDSCAGVDSPVSDAKSNSEPVTQGSSDDMATAQPVEATTATQAEGEGSSRAQTCKDAMDGHSKIELDQQSVLEDSLASCTKSDSAEITLSDTATAEPDEATAHREGEKKGGDNRAEGYNDTMSKGGEDSLLKKVVLVQPRLIDRSLPLCTKSNAKQIMLASANDSLEPDEAGTYIAAKSKKVGGSSEAQTFEDIVPEGCADLFNKNEMNLSNLIITPATADGAIHKTSGIHICSATKRKETSPNEQTAPISAGDTTKAKDNHAGLRRNIKEHDDSKSELDCVGTDEKDHDTHQEPFQPNLVDFDATDTCSIDEGHAKTMVSPTSEDSSLWTATDLEPVTLASSSDAAHESEPEHLLRAQENGDNFKDAPVDREREEKAVLSKEAPDQSTLIGIAGADDANKTIVPSRVDSKNDFAAVASQQDQTKSKLTGNSKESKDTSADASKRVAKTSLSVSFKKNKKHAPFPCGTTRSELEGSAPLESKGSTYISPNELRSDSPLLEGVNSVESVASGQNESSEKRSLAGERRSMLEELNALKAGMKSDTVKASATGASNVFDTSPLCKERQFGQHVEISSASVLQLLEQTKKGLSMETKKRETETNTD